MKILMTGASGLVGKRLARSLILAGHEIVVISRRPEQMPRELGYPVESFYWAGVSEHIDPQALEGIHGVIHLMGEPIAKKRWSASRKNVLKSSRVRASQLLISALNRQLEHELEFFISASAIGYYADGIDVDETSDPGEGFLSSLCQDWEASLDELKYSKRKLILRFANILAHEGGMLRKLRQLFYFGLGARIGDQSHYLSWIHIEDAIGLIQEALVNSAYQGTINVVAPEPASYDEFNTILARTLSPWPWLMRVPAALIRLGLGEMSELILSDQRVRSKRLVELNYKYRYPDLNLAMQEALGIMTFDSKSLVCERYEACQFLAKPTDEVFRFFCDPYELESITPPLLKFVVKGMNTQNIEKGSLIDYQFKLHNIPMRWQSLIREWDPGFEFVDFQNKGPFSIWHHRHQFYPVKGGTLMFDRVDFRLPLGFIGRLIAYYFVTRDVKKIFTFRFDTMAKKFSSLL